MEPDQSTESRIDRLEKASDQARFILAIGKWAAGALLMLLVFVVNQCSENAASIKANVVVLQQVNQKLFDLEKEITILRELEYKDQEAIRINTGKLEGIAGNLQDLDKRATVNRETEAKDIALVKELTAKSDNDLQRQIDTLGFQIQMTISPTAAIKKSLKPQPHGAQ